MLGKSDTEFIMSIKSVELQVKFREKTYKWRILSCVWYLPNMTSLSVEEEDEEECEEDWLWGVEEGVGEEQGVLGGDIFKEWFGAGKGECWVRNEEGEGRDGSARWLGVLGG